MFCQNKPLFRARSEGLGGLGAWRIRSIVARRELTQPQLTMNQSEKVSKTKISRQFTVLFVLSIYLSSHS